MTKTRTIRAKAIAIIAKANPKAIVNNNKHKIKRKGR